MEFLGGLPCDQKLAIITLVGPTGSGKSALANKLLHLADDQEGFSVREDLSLTADPSSPEAQKKSHTQGIMIWNRTIKLKNGAKLLVLDM